MMMQKRQPEAAQNGSFDDPDGGNVGDNREVRDTAADCCLVSKCGFAGASAY